MKKFVLLLFVCTISLSTLAKEKYLVYFKDKPHESVSSLKKSSQQYEEVIQSLSPRSIERRLKVIGKDILLESDLPINELYVEQLINLGAEIVWKLKWFNAVSCYLDEYQLQQVADFDFVDRVEPVAKMRYKRHSDEYEDKTTLQRTQSTLLDYGPSFSQMELSDVPILHDHNINGANVIVGLLDSGFKTDEHEAFENTKILATRDFVFGDNDVGNDGDASHGTRVLSLVGGFKEGQLVSPAFGSEFILSKTEDIFQEVNAEEDNYAAAVEWMESLGADVMSSSLGYNEFDSGQRSYTYAEMDGKTTLVTRAYEAAFDRGIVTVTSAGNEGNNSWQHITAPGDGENVITVGSVNLNNELVGSSSRGPTSDGRIKPELLARGANNYKATIINNSYESSSGGTSFSAPIVAGIAAQLLSVFPHLTNTQVRQMLVASGDNVDEPNNDRGYGLLSARKAIEYPNLQITDTETILHKVFLPLSEVNTQEVFVHLLRDGSDAVEIYQMVYDDSLAFSFTLPTSLLNDGLEINFEYKDAEGNLIRIPSDFSKSYFYESGSNNHLIVKTNSTPPPVVPDDFSVSQNYPNPFNPSTRIEFEIAKRSNVRITVYDMLGRRVKELLNEERDAGFYNDVVWNATNNHGRIVSSGAYFYVFKAGNSVDAKKMVYLR